jgi:hypothetical protein
VLSGKPAARWICVTWDSSATGSVPLLQSVPLTFYALGCSSVACLVWNTHYFHVCYLKRFDFAADCEVLRTSTLFIASNVTFCLQFLAFIPQGSYVNVLPLQQQQHHRAVCT